jgi:hypothetical protein
MTQKQFIVNKIRKYLNESVNLGHFTKQEVFDTILNNEFNWYDLYPDYSEEFDEDEETMFQNKEKAEQYADYVILTFESLPNPIPIYRALYSKNINSIDLEYLGESWSMYKENAISFGSHNNSNFLIEATIDKKFVDWNETLKRFVIFSGAGDVDDENEIVVEDMTMIKNIKILPLKYK